MGAEELRLTPNILKTIGENTKMMILKMLSSGPKIPTDISRKLNKSTPTIVEHLEKLSSVGLVEKKVQEGKKYVFYSLTETGRELIFNRGRLSIVLYGSIALFVAGILLLGFSSYSNISYQASALAVPANRSTTAVQASIQSTSLAVLNLASIIILILAFVLLFVYIAKLRKIKIRISG